MSHELGFCQPGDVPRVMAFIDSYYRSGHPLARHRELFDWQYGNGAGGAYNVVLAFESSSSEILGLLGFVDSKRYDAALAPDNCLWLALWQVKPGARIPSLGVALLKYLREQVEHKILAVSGIRTALQPMYRAMGFEMTNLAHHFLLNPTVREHHIAVIPQRRVEPRTVSPSDIRLCPLTKDNFSVETLHHSIGVDRTPRKSPAYFYNRYLCHPFYEYLVYLVKRGNLPLGLLTARIVTHNGWRAMRVVDLLLESRDIPYLGAPLLDLIVATDCEYGDLLQAGLDESHLRAAGFEKVTPESGVIVPNYFEPFVRENVQITACFRGADRAEFIVYKGDGDQDRPNLT